MTLKWRSMLVITDKEFKNALSMIEGSRTIRTKAND